MTAFRLEKAARVFPWLLATALAGCTGAPADDDVESDVGALTSPPTTGRATARRDAELATLRTIRDAYLAASRLDEATLPSDSQLWIRRNMSSGVASVHTVPGVNAPGPKVPDRDGRPIDGAPTPVFALEYRGVTDAAVRRQMGVTSGAFTIIRFYTFDVSDGRAGIRYHGQARWLEPIDDSRAPRWFAPSANDAEVNELTGP